jgi:cytochrome c
MIKNGDDTIERGGRTGPNLYGVVGRTAGTEEGYNYDKAMKEAGEKGLVWDEAKIAEYLHDPSAYLQKFLDDKSVRSKMTYKLKKGNEDVAAYLASVAK